jgi:DNA-binding response OmpR family regulator
LSLDEKIISNLNDNGCPIFFFSSDQSDINRINSFELGAIDFIPRVIAPDELALRIKSGVEFYRKNKNIIEFGSLILDFKNLKSYIKEKEIFLTFLEFKILYFIMRNHPAQVTKDQLISSVWPSEYVLDATIYTHVSNLNKKLKDWEYEIIGLKIKGIQLMKKAC